MPDTTPNWHEDRVEEVTIAAIDGNTVTLNQSLGYDHRGAKLPDGRLQYLPHLGNLSRNVVLRSENPDGVRGHVAFLARADVSVRYARFQNMGRTTNSALDQTVIEDGILTHVGTNPSGRYALHFHHVIGPLNPTNTGYQFQAVGNALDGGLKWSLVVHASHFGLIAENFVYDTVGGGIVTEDGSEAFNRFDGNFVVKTSGDGFFKHGTDGEAFWFRGPLNQIVNNVAANSKRAAFDIFLQNLHRINAPEAEKPLVRGAAKGSPTETTRYNAFETPFLEFHGNEVYGSHAVFDNWYTQPAQNTYVNDLVGWHTNDNNFGVSSYVNRNLVIDGLELIGDFEGLDPRKRQIYQPIPSTGIQAIRQSENLSILNSVIRGAQIGVETPRFKADRMVIADSTIQAYIVVDVNV